MIFDFVFTKIELKKNQLYDWLINEMVSKGWENLSSNKTTIDYATLFSTGEDGQSKIGIHLRPFYTGGASYHFNTTTYGYFTARPFHNYAQNPNITTAGAYTPNEAWVNIRLIPSEINPEETVIIHYHINKDRAIIVAEGHNNTPTLSASFFILGKPHTIANSNEYTQSAVITSHGSNSCRSGVVGNNAPNLHIDSVFRLVPISKGRLNEKQYASDIVISNTLEGDKFIVENIFVTNFDNSRMKNLTLNMRQNTFKDSEGRIYKLCVSNFTSNIQNTGFKTFIIRIG